MFFQHGNRDFLVGPRFARAAGCTLLDDPTVVDLHGTPALLMHGDLLCTDDVAYLRFRRKARNRVLQRLFLWRSLRRRRAIAADYRRRSAAAVAEKTEEIMDANEKAVRRYMRESATRVLIHGHTHRPARHDFELDGRPATRWVLAQWHPHRGEVLCSSERGISREEVV